MGGGGGFGGEAFEVGDIGSGRIAGGSSIDTDTCWLCGESGGRSVGMGWLRLAVVGSLLGENFMLSGYSLAFEFGLFLAEADWSEEWLEMGEEVFVPYSQIPV